MTLISKIISTSILVTVVFCISCNQPPPKEFIEISDASKHYKISFPKDWTITKDNKYHNVHAEHPTLKEKFSISIEWVQAHGFGNEEELKTFIKTTEDLIAKGIDFPKTVDKGCTKKESLTLCKLENKGMDFEGKPFVSFSLHITKNNLEQEHLLFSSRVSQSKFTEKQEVLIERVSESLVYN